MKQPRENRPELLGRKRHYRRYVIRLLLASTMLGLSNLSWAQSRDYLRLQEQAAKAEADGQVGRALDLYPKALAAAPQWAEGWWRYGRLLYEEHRFPEAAQVFGRLIRLAPGNPLGYALLGLCEYEEADWSNALLHLNKAVNRGGLPPDISQAATYHLALVLMRTGNRGGALVALNSLFQQAPQFPGLTLAQGSAELNLKEPPAPGEAEYAAAQLAGTAVVAVLEVRSDDAERSYRDLVTQFPDLPFAHLAFGLFLESHHRDDEAMAQFTTETKLSPNRAEPWLWLARVALVQQNPPLARTYAARARELDPDDSLSFLIEGRCFMLERQWESALDPLRTAEKRAPYSSEVHYALASVYSELHRAKDAEQERQLFLQAQSTSAVGEGANR